MSLPGLRAINSTSGSSPSPIADPSSAAGVPLNRNGSLANVTNVPITVNSSATAAGSRPISAAAAKVRANTNTAVDCLFGFQIGSLVLALLLASPLIIRHIKTGRYRKGWFLTRNKEASSSLSDMAIALRSVNRAYDVPIGQKRAPLAIRLRQFYNRSLLISIPLTRLTVGRLLVLLITLSFVLFGLLYQNTSDLFANFKRPGWVALSFMPFQFLLAMKNSPIGLTGRGYNHVNYIHRFIGNAIFILGVLHGYIYWKKHRLAKIPIVWEGTPLYGLITLVAFAVISLSSTKWIRSRMYQTFLVCHILGYLIALVALWKHVPFAQPIVYICASLIVVDYFVAYLKTSVRSAVFTSLPGGLTKIEVDRLGDGWRAGQHVYLRVFNGRQSFEKHPFTIANAPASLSPSGRTSLVLMAKAAGNFTSKMHRVGYAEAALVGGDLESSKGPVDEKNLQELSEAASDRRLAVAVEGPYGTSYMDMCDYETVLLVAGGSGFTYCMSIFEHVIGNTIKAKGFTKRIFVLWTLRDLEMVQVFASALNTAVSCAEKLRLEIVVRLYVTTPLKHGDTNPVPTAQITPGRVDLNAVLVEALEITSCSIDSRGETQGCGVAIGVCGPEGLTVSARKAVNTVDESLATKAGGIYLHSEDFAC